MLKRITLRTSVFILIWYLLYYFDILGAVLPSPFNVLSILFSSEATEILLRMTITIKTVSIALIISVPIGYGLGLYCAFSQWIYNLAYPTFNGIKSVPITVFIPLFLVIFHLEHFVIPMICVPLIATLGVNIANASRSVNNTRENIINSMQIGKWDYFRHILLWETLETFYSTLRVILTYALTLEIAFDYFLRYNKGIGDYISSYYEAYQDEKYAYMYAGIIAASVAGVVIIKVLDNFGKRALQWKIRMH